MLLNIRILWDTQIKTLLFQNNYEIPFQKKWGHTVEKAIIISCFHGHRRETTPRKPVGGELNDAKIGEELGGLEQIKLRLI